MDRRETIRSLLSGSEDDQLWLGTGGGLLLFDPETRETQIPEGKLKILSELGKTGISHLFRDQQNNLWAGSWKMGGLASISSENGSYNLRYYLEKDGLPGSIITDIFEDTSGNLWISSPKGISKLDLREGSIQTYRTLNGREIGNIRYFDRATNELWLSQGGSNERGFVIIHSDSLPQNTYKPPVFISSLGVYDYKNKQAEFQERPAPWAKKSLTLPHHQKHPNRRIRRPKL